MLSWLCEQSSHKGNNGNGNASLGSDVELKQTPRAGEHLLGLEEHDHVRVEDMADKLPEVAKVVGICGRCGCNILVSKARGVCLQN